MKNRILSFGLIGLVCLLSGGIVVNAETFKNGDTTYVLEEREFVCEVEGEEVEVYFEGVFNGNLILAGNTRDEYYKLASDNECVSLTKQELLDVYNREYDWYDIIEEDDGESQYYILKTTDYGYYDYGFVKTEDTTLQDKEYYTKDENEVFSLVNPEELNVEDIADYYEEVYLKMPSSVQIDEELTYYTYVDGFYEEVLEPTSVDILNYYIIASEEDCWKEERIKTLDSEVVKGLYEDYDYVWLTKDETNNIFYFVAETEIETEIEDGYDYEWFYDIYTIDGELIEEFVDLEDFNVYSDSLFGVSKEGKIKIYNSSFNSIYETDEFVYFYEMGYDSNVHHMLAVIENEDEYETKYYLMHSYKLLEGEEQTYKDKDLTFRFSGELDKVSKVLVNDKELDKENYTLESGSTIVTLKEDYLSSLKSGTYTLTVLYNDGGEASADFEIEELPPQTGDDIASYFIIGLISLLGVFALTINLKKQAKN